MDLKTDKKINVGEIYYFEEYLKNQFKIGQNLIQKLLVDVV